MSAIWRWIEVRHGTAACASKEFRALLDGCDSDNPLVGPPVQKQRRSAAGSTNLVVQRVNQVPRRGAHQRPCGRYGVAGWKL